MRSPVKEIQIPVTATVSESIEAIDRGAMQMALVVDADGRLLATVSDGDVRRGLLRGIGLGAPVREIMCSSPATVNARAGQPAALKLMRERNLHQIPVLDDDGRVVGLEFIDDIIAKSTNETWVVLMAGGEGVRLRPLTETVPKPMLPIGGRPLLETILKNLADQGFTKYFISVNHQRHVIQNYFGDGSEYGVEIRYLVEDKRLGTAGALSLLPEKPTKPVIVMNGDLMTSVRFENLLRFHEDQGSDATLCVREYSTKIPYGVVRVDGTKLTGIHEKPEQSFMVNAGIYVLGPRALEHVPNGEICDMPKVFRALIANGGNATVYHIQEYWLDIGRMEDLETAEKEFPDVFY